jgi:hypothetical protein
MGKEQIQRPSNQKENGTMKELTEEKWNNEVENQLIMSWCPIYKRI